MIKAGGRRRKKDHCLLIDHVSFSYSKLKKKVFGWLGEVLWLSWSQQSFNSINKVRRVVRDKARGTGH